eukprot:4919661-Pleurochrysis_carterae.AAC.1
MPTSCSRSCSRMTRERSSAEGCATSTGGLNPGGSFFDVERVAAGLRSVEACVLAFGEHFSFLALREHLLSVTGSC